MKIEKEKIQLAPLNIEQIRMSGAIVGMKTSRNFHVNPTQIEMLDLMKMGASIEDIFQDFIQRKSLISFISLYELIQFLLAEKLILNPNFVQYFSNLTVPKKETFLGKLLSTLKPESRPTKEVEAKLREIPFLRSLEPELLDLFLKNMRVVDVPSGFAICKEGEAQRSLFVLLKGSASVYKRSLNKKRQRLAVLSENSVFGEVGFFLGEPRTADVVTDERSTVVRLKYKPEIFDDLIKKETARNLQKRFWVIHALLKSEVFKGVPEDCFDALVFSGVIKKIPGSTVLFREGDIGETCYIVVQGSMVVSKGGESIRVLGQGDCVGEIALLSNRGKRSATVTTQSEVLVLEIHYQNFYKLLSQNLILACEFEKLAAHRLQDDHERK